ncbi:MAG: dTDP-glucose 4,6-dehydratase [Anaerolineales bacterium]
MKNILVTGGAGFIGSNFIHYLFAREPGAQITNLDALTYAGSEENLRGLPAGAAYSFVHGDILDGALVASLLRERKIDTIVHFAAESHVDRSIHGPAQFVQTNVTGTLSMLEAARQVWLNEKTLPLEMLRFHHISTDEVFGTLAPGAPAWTEEIAYAPNSPYAASKASSDHLVRAYGHTYGLPVSITNCSNNYGPRQFPEKLIPLMILNALEGKPLPVYGDGQQIRDWLYVDDHCEAIYRILQGGRAGETYNVGGGNQPANLTIVETICDLLDELRPAARSYRAQIQFVPDRPGHDRRYAMDYGKLTRELGWQPRYDLTSGLRETLRWYLENPAWVEKIRQQSDIQQWMQKNYAERKR